MAKRKGTDGTETENTKRLSVKEAEKIRTIREVELMGIDCFVSPTPKVDSGANGKVDELMHTASTSRKYRVSSVGQVDLYIRFTKDGKRVTLPVENKTNGGEITAIYKALNRGKDGLILYSLNVCNSNTNNKRRDVSTRIMRYSTFWSMLEACGAIRYNKKTTAGGTCMAIEPTKKGLVALLERMTEYDDSRVMDISEIV